MERKNGRFVSRPSIERFLERFERNDSDCWIWTACIDHDGYGMFAVSAENRSVKAHRFSYELFVNAIPIGLTIDHLCRNRACINPKHLEVVTRKENTLRGVGPAALNAKKTVCRKGHTFSASNTYYSRYGRSCRACNLLAAKKYQESLKQRGAA